MAMTADKYGYRQYLNEKGHKDEDITWENGTVMLKGKSFGAATPEADGKTYNSLANLDNLYNKYDQQSNKDEVRNMLTEYRNRINTPTTPFSYDPNNDQQYQNALRQAQAGAQTATNNAMVGLGRRGIGNSSSAVTAANSIQQRAIGDVNSQVLPQLMNQAYQRYMDQQNMERAKANDLLGLAGVMSDTQYRDDRATRSDFESDRNFEDRAKQGRIDLASQLSQQYGTNVTPTYDPALTYEQVAGMTPMAARQQQLANAWKAADETGAVTQELSQLTGLPVGMQTHQAKQLAISQQNADTSQIGANLQEKRYQDAADERSFTSTLMGDLSQLSSEEEFADFLNTNAGPITEKIGVEEFLKIKQMALSQFRNNGDAEKLREMALRYAQGDPNWKYAFTPEEQSAITNYYINYLSGK